MLKAKTKDGCRFSPIVSCSGVMFFENKFTIVPSGFEQEAKDNPFLDVHEMADDDELLRPPPVVEEVVDKEEVEIVGEPEVEADLPKAEVAPPIFDAVEEPKQETNATPAAKELASSMKLKLSWITGTGKDGKIVQKDVEDYLAQKEAKAETKE